MRRIVLVVLSATLLVGCASNPVPPDALETPLVKTPSASSPSASDESQALGLVGLWRVSGASGEQSDTWLRLDTVDFQLWRDCGMIQGSWTAGEAAFIASTYGASGGCADGRLPRVAWLESATAYEPTGEGWRLTDGGGSVVATLAVDGAPGPIDTAADSTRSRPR